MTDEKRIRVAVNGYGVIGKRVADAVAAQNDMEMAGVADVTADWRARMARAKGFALFAADPDRAPAMRAAGLDVVTVEPAPAGNPLFALDNLVVMPHIAWITPETLDRSLGIAFENCRRVRDGEDLLHRVV